MTFAPRPPTTQMSGGPGPSQETGREPFGVAPSGLPASPAHAAHAAVSVQPPRRGQTSRGKLATDFSLALLPFPGTLAGAGDVLVGPGARHLLVPVAPSAQSTPGEPHGSKLSTGGPANRGVGLSTRRSVTNGGRRLRRAFVG